MASSLLALIICQAESPNCRSAACYQPQTHRLTAAATLTPVPRIPNTPHLHSLTLTEPSAVALWGVGNARKRKWKRGLQRESGRKSVCDCVTVFECLAPRVCVFLPLETSLISLLTAAISFLARQRTATVLSRWPKMTWLSRLSSSSKCESMVTSVELAGSGTQADDSLAQLGCSSEDKAKVRSKSQRTLLDPHEAELTA